MRNLEHQNFSIKTEFWILSSYEAEVIKANLDSMLSLTMHISIHTGVDYPQIFKFCKENSLTHSIAKEKRVIKYRSEWIIPFSSCTRYTDVTERLLYVHFSFSNVYFVWFSRREVNRKQNFHGYALNRWEQTEIIWATDTTTTLKKFRENGSKTVFRVG